MSDWKVDMCDRVAVLTFGGEHVNNTFSTAKMHGLGHAIDELGHDAGVGAVVLTAGARRSFGVGGDFHEVHRFTGGTEVTEWIRACVGMYRAPLASPVPVVAAIEGYAIGIGLQLALCADYRVAAANADLRMPELELGVACVLGAYLLERRVGTGLMTRMILSSVAWTSDEALEDGLVHEVVDTAATLDRAVEFAGRLASYKAAAFTETKQFMNDRVIAGLDRAQEAAIGAHRRGFAASSDAQDRMREVIGEPSGGRGRAERPASEQG
ncbi:MAG TPA: enoyl-CoA hydratase/isomerase family protein [Solirubrobacteraceae bacterium]|jgi:enoyl-CoA hydratase/carnithine racemase|nr:enoyl-CoA hydratase/isomerase family protein [Solirubrobacteraceae bacterium]